MALPHAAAGALIDLQDAADVSRFSAIALAKTDELELIRLTLPAGKVLPEHHVPGEITLLCLQGRVRIALHTGSQTLQAGQMLYLHGGQVHALYAQEDSLLLLTILLLK